VVAGLAIKQDDPDRRGVEEFIAEALDEAASD
jgi:hypothetical protein